MKNSHAQRILDAALFLRSERKLWLSGWVDGDPDLYALVREPLSSEELEEFDIEADELTQRTYLALIAEAVENRYEESA